MLATLRQHGFLHLTSQAALSADELAQLRRVADDFRRTTLCRTVAVNLETASVDSLRARIDVEATAPELQLRCARLADHTATLTELARLRQAGTLRLHHATIQTGDLAGVADVVQSVRRLGAAVIVNGVPWPAPDGPITGLDVLTRAGVPVLALMVPGPWFLEPAARARALAWAGSVFLTGLCLDLDADALWSATQPTEDDFVAVFEAARALEDDIGDLRIVNLPSDEVLLGNATSPDSTAARFDTAQRFRSSYLRWRLPLLKAAEGDNTFSQTPEAEEKLVRLQEDLLPNHPELLGVGLGSVIVNVCGGNGRVARRLSPLVGPDGLVISVEMLRCVTDPRGVLPASSASRTCSSAPAWLSASRCPTRPPMPPSTSGLAQSGSWGSGRRWSRRWPVSSVPAAASPSHTGWCGCRSTGSASHGSSSPTSTL